MMTLIVIGFLRWKMTTYIYRFSIMNKDARKHIYQELPWVPIVAIIAIFLFPTLGLIAKRDNSTTLTVYLCYGTILIFGIISVIEAIRKLRI